MKLTEDNTLLSVRWSIGEYFMIPNKKIAKLRQINPWAYSWHIICDSERILRSCQNFPIMLDITYSVVLTKSRYGESDAISYPIMRVDPVQLWACKNKMTSARLRKS